MTLRNRLFTLLILLAVITVGLRAYLHHQPIKSPADQNAYRYLELKNGMQVLLISNPQTDTAAASLNVGIGSQQNPPGRQGLAHFLEHMLFLGTKSYPDAGEYQAFISQHGGSHNAFTAATNTNYYFDISADKLTPALDRFSKFFTEPLFNEEYVQREKEAVNSEYSSKSKDEYYRINHVIKSRMNPEHPESQFAVGSLETLSDNDTSKIRDDLIAFYNQYYSANIMTLAVMGKESLDELEDIVRSRFKDVVNHKVKLKPNNEPVFIADTLPQDISIEPIQDIYRLSFSFPVENNTAEYKDKSDEYIGHLLGHEGKGSLLDYLKQKGWAEGLAAGTNVITEQQASLDVSINLTPEGYQHVDDITEQFFAYVNLISEKGVLRWIFNENKKLADIHFKFQEAADPISTVQAASLNMQYYPPKDILRGAYLWSDYQPQRIQELLAEIRPDNMLRIKVAKGIHTELVEPYFNARYAVNNFSDAQMERFESPVQDDALSIIKANPFIPDNVELVSPAADKIPQKILSAKGLTLYQQTDLSFQRPQASLYINLRSPLMAQAPEMQAALEIWVALLNDGFSDFSYPAALAGQDFSLYTHMRGIGLRLYGYPDKQPALLDKIITEMRSKPVNQEKFEQLKNSVLMAYQNALVDAPYERLIARLNQHMLENSYSEVQMIDAITGLDFNAFNGVIQQFWQQLDIVILSHGNISRVQSLALAEDIKVRLLQDATAVEVPRKQVRQLPVGTEKLTQPLDHPDSAMVYYLQGSEAFNERAAMGLIGQIISSGYFNFMRTQRQYGYTVFATPYPMVEQAGLAFIVQSNKTDAQTLYGETQRFIQKFELTLLNMPPADYSAHQQGLVQRLLEKPRNLQEKTNLYWRDIDRGNDNFDTAQQIAAAVEATSKDQLLEYYNEHLINRNLHGLLIGSSRAKP